MIKFLEGDYLSATTVLNNEIVGDGENQLQLEFRHVARNTTLFSSLLLAVQTNQQNPIVGYCAFSFGHKSAITQVDFSLIELSNIKVFPDYFRRGIGNMLLDYSKIIAHDQDRVMVLKPQQPGEIMIESFRIEKWPMTDDQLKEWYMSHGFRELSEEEIVFYAELAHDKDLTFNLWCKGLDPRSMDFGKKRSSMSPEEALLLAHISYDDKVALIRPILLDQYGTDNLIGYNYQNKIKSIEKYLIEDI